MERPGRRREGGLEAARSAHARRRRRTWLVLAVLPLTAAPGACRIVVLTECTQAALEQALAGPRREIHFACSGDITLDRDLVIENDGIVLAGETAPDGGVEFRGGHSVILSASHLEVRYLRFRPGPGADGPKDALSVLSPPGRVIRDIFVHHNSIQWATDENVEIVGYYGGAVRDVRFAHNLIAEALAGWGGKGALVDGDFDRVVFESNVFAHNVSRNPLATLMGNVADPGSGAARLEVLGNLFYHQLLGTELSVASEGWRLRARLLGNVYRSGPADLLKREGLVGRPKAPISVREDTRGPVEVALLWNVSDRRSPGQRECLNLSTTWANEPCDGQVGGDEVGGSALEPDPEARVAALLAEVGATRPCRDAVDTRIVGSIPAASGVWPETEPATAWPDLSRSDCP